VTSLSVWIFDTAEEAEPALRTLGRLEMQGHLDVDDAAVLTWPSGDIRPRTYQAGSACGDTALSGAFWGLLFGLVFLLPLTDRLREGTDDGFGLGPVGLPDRFLGEVRHRVGPGTSALFLLTPDAAVERVAAAVGATGSDGLVVLFAGPEERALHRAFAAAQER
jgi:uncharacterized membrane protein